MNNLNYVLQYAITQAIKQACLSRREYYYFWYEANGTQRELIRNKDKENVK